MILPALLGQLWWPIRPKERCHNCGRTGGSKEVRLSTWDGGGVLTCTKPDCKAEVEKMEARARLMGDYSQAFSKVYGRKP